MKSLIHGSQCLPISPIVSIIDSSWCGWRWDEKYRWEKILVNLMRDSVTVMRSFKMI